MQQLCEKSNIAPLDVISYCNLHGYYFELEHKNNFYRCNLLKDDILKKEGVKKYSSWGEAYRCSYAKLYDKLTGI